MLYIATVTPAIIATVMSNSVALILCLWLLPIPALVLMFREVRASARLRLRWRRPLARLSPKPAPPV